MKQHAGVDEAEVDSLHRDLMPCVLEKAWVISIPNPYVYNMWWPWLKNYHGELSIGFVNANNYLKYAWLDQNLKNKMEY